MCSHTDKRAGAIATQCVRTLNPTDASAVPARETDAGRGRGSARGFSLASVGPAVPPEQPPLAPQPLSLALWTELAPGERRVCDGALVSGGRLGLAAHLPFASEAVHSRAQDA